MPDPFAALADDHRRSILGMLGRGGMAVVDIAERLPISRPAVSRHLKVLSEAGLVEEEPQGTRRIYRLRQEGADAVRLYLEQVWGSAATRFTLYAENTAPQDVVHET